MRGIIIYLLNFFQSILGDFNKEQESFIKEQQSKTTDAAVPPWVGVPNEESLKEECLSLSLVSTQSEKPGPWKGTKSCFIMFNAVRAQHVTYVTYSFRLLRPRPSAAAIRSITKFIRHFIVLIFGYWRTTQLTLAAE